MGFTTPCFIRKNTPEIRKRLKDLGYKECIGEEGPFLFTSYNIFDCMHSECGLNDLAYNGLIDCGTNEELFLAIASLRYDKDEDQLFISDSLLHIAFDDEIGNDHYFTYPSGVIFKWDYHWDNCTIKGEFHKMSVEELINHFKVKK